jgi:hypothetical protein
MATTFMNLDLPTVTVTLGPAWATALNAAIEVVDSHDHTSGKGTRVPTAGININADLDFNEFAVQNQRYSSFEQRTSSPSGSEFAASTSVYNGDFYYTNTSGVAVQVTSGGSLVSSPGNAQIFETQAVSSNLTISPGDTFVYLIVDTTVARSITLPLANGVTAGRIYIIKDSDGQANTNNITVNISGSDTIDGASSQVLDSNFGSSMIVTDGVDSWYIS